MGASWLDEARSRGEVGGAGGGGGVGRVGKQGAAGRRWFRSDGGWINLIIVMLLRGSPLKLVAVSVL